MEVERQVSRLLSELKKVQTVTQTLTILSQLRALIKSETKLSKSCHANFTQSLTNLTENDHPFIARDAAILLVVADASVEFPESLDSVSIHRLQYLRLKIQFSARVPLARLVRCIGSVSASTPLPILDQFLALISEAADIAGSLFSLAIAAPLVKHVFVNFHTQTSVAHRLATLAKLSPVAAFLLERGNPRFDILPLSVVAVAVRAVTSLEVAGQKITTELLVTLLKRSLACLIGPEADDHADALAVLQALMASGLVSSGRLAIRETRQLVSTIVAVCRKLKRRDLREPVRDLFTFFDAKKDEDKISVCPVELLEPPKKRVCTLSYARTERLVIAETQVNHVAVSIGLAAEAVEKNADEITQDENADDVFSLQLDSPSEAGDL
jgi:hypothetical protein